MNSATVSMPIGDFDKLRDDLKTAQDRVRVLEDNERQMTVHVTQIVTHSYTQPSWSVLKDEKPKLGYTIKSYKNMVDIIEPIKLQAKEEASQLVESLESQRQYVKEQLREANNKIKILEAEVITFHNTPKNEEHKKVNTELHELIYNLKIEVAQYKIQVKVVTSKYNNLKEIQSATKWYHLLFHTKPKV